MEKFFIQATEYTPMVHFDPSRGLIEFRGNSSPSDSHMFYHRVILNLEEYSMNMKQGLTANLSFSYFNTSSSKCLYLMLKKITLIQSSGRKVIVNWYYRRDDEEMKEVGMDFSEIMNLKFNFIELVN